MPISVMPIFVTENFNDKFTLINPAHIVTISKDYDQGDGRAVITLSTGAIVVTKEDFETVSAAARNVFAR